MASGAVLLALVIAATSTVPFLAAYRFDFQALLADPGSAVAGGPGTAALFHWGAVGDMLYSYLLLAPLALYLHSILRPRMPWLADLGTVGAFGYIFIGAAGAAMLAAAGPPLIEAYATAAAPDRAAISSSFHLLTSAALLGLWPCSPWARSWSSWCGPDGWRPIGPLEPAAYSPSWSVGRLPLATELAGPIPEVASRRPF